MPTPSFAFLGFAAVAAALYNLVGASWRPPLLLLINLAFLAGVSSHLLVFAPLAGFVLFGFVAVRLLQAGRRRLFLLLLTVALAGFVWLGKYSFVPARLQLDQPYLALGLSFVLLRIVHLLIDSRDGARERITLTDYLNYVLDFTCLAVGPIQLYRDWRASAPLSAAGLGVALERIALGLFKAFVVAGLLLALHKQAIVAAGQGGEALRRVACGLLVVGVYPLYLYAAFSGYVDVVVGVARLFRRRLPENFDRPFASTNFIEFWSRWHMSLSAWFRTYVYNPLLISLMRRFPGRAAEPLLAATTLFVSFFLLGLWHGSTREIMVFALLQGAGVGLNKLWQVGLTAGLGKPGYRSLADHPLYATVARGLTFAWFALSLLWFWSSSADIAALAHALGPAGVAFVLVGLVLLAGVVLSVLAAVGDRAEASGVVAALKSRYLRTAAVTAMAAVVVFTGFLFAGPASAVVFSLF